MRSILPEEVPLTDRGFLLGDGLFETIRVDQHRLLFLEQHLQRLARGASYLDIPFSISQAKAKLLHELSKQPYSSAVARLTLTRGSGSRGLNPPQHLSPHLFVTISPFEPLSHHPWKLWISSIRRNEKSPSSQLKTLSYIDNVLARMEALKNGADEALMLNTEGFVACAAAGNIFIEKEGMLLTPPLSEGVLPGIMRAEILKSPGAKEQRLTLEDCFSASAVYVTNVLIGKKIAALQAQSLSL